jgi:hypothetical protein
MLSRITIHALFWIVSLGTNADIIAIDLSPSEPFGKSGSFRVRSELSVHSPFASGFVQADVRMIVMRRMIRYGITFLSFLGAWSGKQPD